MSSRDPIMISFDVVNIYVLTYGRDMTIGRYRIWEKAINSLTKSKSKSNKKSDDSHQIQYTIQQYRKGILSEEVTHSLYTKKVSPDAVDLKEHFVLIIHQSFCSKLKCLDKIVKDAVVEFLRYLDSFSISIRTERWLCREVDSLDGGIPSSNLFDDMTPIIKDRVGKLNDDHNVMNPIEIISSGDDEEGGSNKATPKLQKVSLSCESLNCKNSKKARYIPQFRPFRATFLSNIKRQQEVKAKFFLHDGIRSKDEARVAALHESLNAKKEVIKAVNAFIQKRAETYKFAFEICIEKQHENKSSDSSKKSTVPEHEIVFYNERIASRLLLLCAGSNALSELGRHAVHDLPHIKSCNKSRSSHMYRDLQYERISRLLKRYPTKVNLSCIDYSYAKCQCKQKKALIDSLESYFITFPVINSDTRLPLIKVGGSTFGRLVRSIIHEEGPLGKFYGFLKDDEDYANDQKILERQEVKAIAIFSKIWGVGVATAAKIVSYGVYSIDELRNDNVLVKALNHQQQIGLSRYEDLLARIPRYEVEEIQEYMTSVVKKVSRNQATTFVCGSYRRGALTCGDVDFLILPNQDVDAVDDAGIKVMGLVLSELRQSGFLTDDLTLPNETNGLNLGYDSLSYMGVCRLSGENRLHRRIDIKAYPGVQAPYALLYFTGDSHFNRSMRAFAKQAGLSLSDSGLGICVRGKLGGKTERIKIGHSALCNSEEEIFELFGTKYIEPAYRICVGTEGRIHSTASSNSQPRWEVLVGEESEEDDSDNCI